MAKARISVVAMTILRNYLRECGVRSFEELSHQQKDELNQLWVQEGVSSSVLAQEVLDCKLRPIVELFGGKLTLGEQSAEVFFVDDQEVMTIEYVDNGIDVDPGQPGLADLRVKLCELEKRLGDDTEGSTVWRSFRESACMLRGADTSATLDFYGDRVWLILANGSRRRYEFTWEGMRHLRRNIRMILRT